MKRKICRVSPLYDPFIQVRQFSNTLHLGIFLKVRGNIPFWISGGSTVITEDYVRLTPAVNSRSGRIWNVKVFIGYLHLELKLLLQPVSFPEWQVEVTFKVGSTNSIGADGMAFW